MMKNDISANLKQECLILCSGSSKGASQYELKILLPWQHTGFQTSPILKAFVATFSVLFSYLRMVPRMYDPTGK